MAWEVKPRRPVVSEVHSDALCLRQLVCRSYQRMPVDVPFGPVLQPAVWDGAPAHAAREAGRAVCDAAAAA
eukprot:4924469-Pyramimonas_sp.AAC.1